VAKSVKESGFQIRVNQNIRGVYLLNQTSDEKNVEILPEYEFEGRVYRSVISCATKFFKNVETIKISGISTKDCWMLFAERPTQKEIVTAQRDGIPVNFRPLKKLKMVDLTNFNTELAVDMSQMFADCVSLREIKFGKFNTSNVESMDAMFENCRALKKLNITNWDTRNVYSASRMFKGCSNLRDCNLDLFDTDSLEYMDNMLVDCPLQRPSWYKGDTREEKLLYSLTNIGGAEYDIF
jgi:surface protein